MFEFGSWEAGADHDDMDRSNEEESVRCRLEARDFKPRLKNPGGKDSNVCIRCRGAREATTGPGRSETHVHRREESALQREM